MVRKVLEFFGFWESSKPQDIFLGRRTCETLDGVVILMSLRSPEKRKIRPIYWTWMLVLATIVVLLGAGYAQALQVSRKTLKDATHIEISGRSEWRYEVSRDQTMVKVQFNGIKPSELDGLAGIKDARIRATELSIGVNGDALVVFNLFDKSVQFFDYQTDSPANLIIDIFKESSPEKKKAAKKWTPRDELVTLVKRSSVNKGRAPASDLPPALPPLLGNSSDAQLQLKFGIFDGGDQELKRFKIDDKEINESGLIKSKEKIYLRFPELTVEHPYLKNLLANQPKYEIPTKDSEENRQARLIVKLYNDDKPALVIRTLKFFREKFPESEYDRVLGFILADTYLKLWSRDHNRTDFEAAMNRYKEILIRYPKDPERFRIAMLIGLSYLDVGNNFGALSTFQSGIRDYPDSPYIWQMRMAVAEALRALNKNSDALAEFEAIENDPASGEYGVEARYRRGDVFFKARDYQAAIKEYREALKRYPTKWADGPNVFFNLSEASFWTGDYKSALDEFRNFLQHFPSHSYGGYAMTRIGEILEILGASQRKVEGAYLEAYFRYRGSPGGYLAKTHINLPRYAEMKEKELAQARKEAREEMPKNIEGIEAFVDLMEADGLSERGQYDQGLAILVKYFKNNVISPYLEIFKDHIIDNLTGQIDHYSATGNDLSALEVYVKNQPLWLAKNKRIDTRYFAARAYEKLNLLEEAAKLYSDCLNEYRSLKSEELRTARVLEKLPSPDQLNLRLAKVNLAMNDLKKAGDFLSSIKEIGSLEEPEQVERSMILARVAEKEERYDIAALALKTLIEKWTGKPQLLAEPWLGLAKIAQRQKKPDEALQWTQKIVDVAKADTEVINSKTVREALQLQSEILISAKKIAEAQASYKLILDKFSDKETDASTRYRLGKLYFDQNNLGEASRIWADLKNDQGGELWTKMADEQLAQAQWNQKYDRYVDRQPAGGSK